MAKASNNKEETKAPAMVTCTYLPATSCHFDHDGKEYYLHHGLIYQLPDCTFIKTLIAQGRLVVNKN